MDKSISHRTIDNLGIDTYAQFEQSRSEKELFITDDAQSVYSQVAGNIMAPVLHSNRDALFGLHYSKQGMATIDAPSDHDIEGRGLFSHLLLPGIGGDEVLSNVIDKISELDTGDKASDASKVVSMLHALLALNTALTTVNAKKMMYSKG